MLGLLVRLSEYSPAFRRFLWRRWYQYLAGYDVSYWHFMNYGYEPLEPSGERLELLPSDEPNRYSIQLYHQVASAVELRGLTIAEIGSGRGGGSSFVHRYHKPASTTGLDFSAKAVRFCQRTHQLPGLSYVQGDAERQPFESASLDAVLNVESSHCYGSMPRFVGEVQRVLKPGGHFLFADFRVPEVAAELPRVFEQAGLEIVEHQEITAEVLRALSLDSERKLKLLEQHVSSRWLPTFRRFAAIEGSDVFEHFTNGTFVYHRYACRKPG